ncbi:hypothetical protein HYW76_00580 [Candidatus Pacearchaeota archaeon]|nr:hypothetical protein [Candidatus Pacearchaeota archaeon]
MKEVIEIFESIDTGILYRRYRKRVDRTNFRTEIKSGLDIAEKLRRINNKAGKEFLFEANYA